MVVVSDLLSYFESFVDYLVIAMPREGTTRSNSVEIGTEIIQGTNSQRKLQEQRSDK